MKRIIQILPYWLMHGILALIISLITGYWLAGTIFYAGREIRDLEKLHDWHIMGFDWKGFLAPLVTSLFLLLIKQIN